MSKRMPMINDEPDLPTKSPLDIKGVDLDMDAAEIVEIIRESREKILPK